MRTGIRKNYKMEKIISHDSHSKTLKGISIHDPSEEVALKSIKFTIMPNVFELKKEISMLKKLDSPNIMKYYEIFEEGAYIFLVMRYCPAGELFDHIARNPSFQEHNAFLIVKNILYALNHCHTNNITHGDNKPENILYSQHQNHSQILLINFCPKTNSTILNSEQTPYYSAPEIFKGEFHIKSDLWSVGVILYIMLSGGNIPFTGKNTQEISDQVLNKKLILDGDQWNNVSYEAKDFLLRLLEKDPVKRPTASEALKHSWFIFEGVIEKGSDSPSIYSSWEDFWKAKMKLEKPQADDRESPQTQSPMHDARMFKREIIERLKLYKGKSNLQKEVMNALAKRLDSKSIQNLTEAFQEMDKDFTGFIDCQELYTTAKSCGLDMTADEIGEIIENVDSNGNGKINYTEFIAATLSTKRFLTKEKLLSLFNHFDSDGSGEITVDNLRVMVEENGKTVREDELQEMIKKHDKDLDEKINLNEFTLMMQEMEVNPFD